MTKAPAPSPQPSADSAEDAAGAGASRQIDRLIAGLRDWRGETLAKARAVIRSADPGIVETWKWRGAPVWEKNGILVVGNAHKAKVKLTFHDGAQLPDPHGLFNAGLDGGKWRAIDLREGEDPPAEPLRALVRAAVAFREGRREAKALKDANA